MHSLMSTEALGYLLVSRSPQSRGAGRWAAVKSTPTEVSGRLRRTDLGRCVDQVEVGGARRQTFWLRETLQLLRTCNVVVCVEQGNPRNTLMSCSSVPWEGLIPKT